MRAAAFFDVDRTLLPGRSMERVFILYLLKTGYLKLFDLLRYCLHLIRNLGGIKRDQVIHQNKLHLKDKDAREIRRLAARCFEEEISPLISREGIRAVEDHRKKGDMVVLITGSLEPLATELKQALGAQLVEASMLEELNGSLSGSLANQRPYGQEKARLARQLAEKHGLDLQASFAYGDHHSDVHLLSQVGNPRAVNPDPALMAEARKRGWKVVSFR